MEELHPIFSSQKSYYKKAHVEIIQRNTHTSYFLYSYGTKIIEIAKTSDPDPLIVYLTPYESHFTNTTLNHLREFAQQHDLPSLTKKEWIALSEQDDIISLSHQLNKEIVMS